MGGGGVFVFFLNLKARTVTHFHTGYILFKRDVCLCEGGGKCCGRYELQDG